MPRLEREPEHSTPPQIAELFYGLNALGVRLFRPMGNKGLIVSRVEMDALKQFTKHPPKGTPKLRLEVSKNADGTFFVQAPDRETADRFAQQLKDQGFSG